MEMLFKKPQNPVERAWYYIEERILALASQYRINKNVKLNIHIQMDRASCDLILTL